MHTTLSARFLHTLMMLEFYQYQTNCLLCEKKNLKVLNFHIKTVIKHNFTSNKNITCTNIDVYIYIFFQDIQCDWTLLVDDFNIMQGGSILLLTD